MTSYPVGNKTSSLSRKPCIPDKKSYYGTLSGSHGRSFKIRHEKSPEASLGGGLTMTSYPVGHKTSLSRKPMMKYWSLSNFYKKQQILILKTDQFINVVNGLSRLHNTANKFFSFDSVALPVNWNVYIGLYETPLQGNSLNNQT